MAYLNWKQGGVSILLASHPKLQNQLHLNLTPENLKLLTDTLTETFEKNQELRIDLPMGWTVFFKVTSGEGRLLMAHPQLEEWVGSFILDTAHARKFLLELLILASNAPIELSVLGGISFLSNLELMISRA